MIDIYHLVKNALDGQPVVRRERDDRKRPTGTMNAAERHAVAALVTVAIQPEVVCPECGSFQLSLTLDHEVTAAGIPDGRLKSNEIQAILVVGCDTCSATVEIVRDTDRLLLLPAVHNITN